MSAGVRPPHLRWAPIALVFLGGGAGAAGREGLSLLIPNLGEVPVAIPIINVVGAFLLGYLYEAVTRTGSTPTGRNLKLLLGTGFCGGFTTYSSLATDTAVLFRDGLPWAALIYAFGTVLVGACATWAGIAAASGINARGSGRRDNGGQEAAT
ncbi:fluoride efflux transporter FluC [Arthrobacter sp. zg-Y769]|uniref:fluoride efflux transporter FluC n=1 Tax=Arthrobacter sp. zg-Y769 TaxID=2894191 RepID=UPI001E2A220C|nr:CrcB family protein [Arthrobacter sp. zg-Y769]MCC9205146.1 CrcB family protein [Arthrobacter sp. zg-Y769]